MIRILKVGLIGTLVAVGVAWLADHPGILAIEWLGYEVRMRFVIGLALLALLGLVVFMVWGLWSLMWSGAARMRRRQKAYRLKKGQNALAHAIVAVAEGQAREAKKSIALAHAMLKAPALTLPIQAQALKLEGKSNGLRKTYEEMLQTPATQLLALRGLYQTARMEGDEEETAHHAQLALKHDQPPLWAVEAVGAECVREKQWQEALAAFKRGEKKGVLTREQFREKQAALLVAEALILEDAPEQVVTMAERALKLRHGWTPAALLGAQALRSIGEVAKAKKMLQQSWQHAPHPQVAELYVGLEEGATPKETLQEMEKLVARNPRHAESKLAVTRAALDAGVWQTARTRMQDILEEPSTRTCLLMAELAEKEGDKAESRVWLGRAVHAGGDYQWLTAAGHTSENWEPLCPRSGMFDTCSWRKPKERVVSTALALLPSASAEPMEAEEEEGVVPHPPDDPGMGEEWGQEKEAL